MLNYIPCKTKNSLPKQPTINPTPNPPILNYPQFTLSSSKIFC